MKYLLSVFTVFSFLLGFAQNADPSGIYRGIFKHGKFQTDIEIDISVDNDQVDVKFNSLAQNAFGIPAGDVNISADSLAFALQSDYYRYDFKCFPIGETSMKGILSVDGNSYDFNLEKELTDKNNANTVKTRDVRLQSQGLFLYGTIYYPEKPNGKAIYLVTSSGDQDRSGSRAEAILFSRAGYISFHIDKRGTGNSDGNWHIANIPELCEDDLHALEFLHQSEQIDYKNIGIKGSSQGATKVPYILKKQPELAFGIAVSCPASTLLESDLNYWKNRNIKEIGEENIQSAAKAQGAVFQYIAGDLTKASLEQIIDEYKSQPWFSHIWVPDLDSVEIDKKLNYSPLPYFEDNKSPLLVIEGTRDEIIPKGSLDLIKSTIGKQGNKKNEFLSLKGANHSMMFQDNADFPYWSSLHPDYMSSMLKWIAHL